MSTISQTNSLIPTTTFASTSSTPTNDSGDGYANLLSAKGSPPLIVAFLAIGVFVIVMFCVFAWRRMSESRRARDQPTTTTTIQGSKFVVPGQRPVLWDAWTAPRVWEKSRVESRAWENVKPVAAVLTYPLPPAGPHVTRRSPIKSVDLGGRVLFRMLRRLGSLVTRIILPDPPPPPPAPTIDSYEKGGAVSHVSDEIEWREASSLQVTVLVAMPKERLCSRETTEEDMDPVRIGLGEFCIGTTDVPWSVPE